ncbi:MAG TPA: MraY family glycosyltransferase [Pirellulales bacterium]|jgi:UDP-GlcNAc:undecaprenyl-phosphate GlcNAc-1-phosphate transferase|nr:MraY family glycosyltransferase [Pirellulales bacterium]
MIAYWFGFIAALLATLALTPAARRVALRARIVDRPDGRRKLQELPVPLLGGVAVLLGWGLGLSFALSVFAHPALPTVTVPALASLTALALIGICDDVHRLRARWKLLGQCLAVLPIVLSGCQLQRLICCGWQFDLGPLGAPATVFWLVLGINAVNLLDGMDGMASIVAVGIAVTIAGIDFFGQTGGITLVIVPLAGALLGFLAFNFPPARIYLGDTGSMAIGLAVSLAALLAAKTESGVTNLTMLAAVMAIPLADTSLAVIRRSLSGCGFWHADRGHLHHRLLAQGLHPRQILMLFFGVSLVWAAIVAVASHRHSDILAWSAAAIAVVLAIRLRLAGHHEWALLTTWIARAPAGLAIVPPTLAELREMPFDAAWHQLVTHLRQSPIESITLAVEDSDGTLAELSWSNVDTLDAVSAIEVMHRSRQAHRCRLRIESSQPMAAGESSRLVAVVDRFAEFWAAHPETVPTSSPDLSVESSSTLPIRWPASDNLSQKRAA